MLQAFIEGNLGAFYRATAEAVDAGAEKALARASGGIRSTIARQVQEAGFSGGGRTLAKSVRSRVTGKGIDAEAIVYSKSAYQDRRGGGVDLINVFAQGAVINAAGGRWLVIPTEYAPLTSGRGRGQRMSLRELIDRGTKVSIIPARGGKKVALASLYGRRVVTHILIKQVSLRKRLDIESVVDRWLPRLPELFAEEVEKAAQASPLVTRYE